MTLLVLLNPKQFNVLQGWKKWPKSRGIPRYPEYEKFEGKFLLPTKNRRKLKAVIDEKWATSEVKPEAIAREVIQAVTVLDESYQLAIKEFENEPLPESFLSLVQEMRVEQEPPPDPLWVISELIVHINIERKKKKDEEEVISLLMSIIH